MLMQPFTEAEQKVVLAHELAHHSQEHLPKGIGWFALFAIPGAWILMRATRGRGGMGAPEAVPLALLVVAVVQLAAAPAANAISRRMEAEADWKALQVTRDPDALEGLMVGFSDTSLDDPEPPGWVELMLGTHPTLADRVAMARAWAARRDG
jgi:STE24 endopeptidase